MEWIVYRKKNYEKAIFIIGHSVNWQYGAYGTKTIKS